jgi:hypothetical protein
MPRVGATPILRAGTVEAACASAAGIGDAGTAAAGVTAGTDAAIGADAVLAGAEEGVAAAGFRA